MKLNTI